MTVDTNGASMTDPDDLQTPRKADRTPKKRLPFSGSDSEEDDSRIGAPNFDPLVKMPLKTKDNTGFKIAHQEAKMLAYETRENLLGDQTPEEPKEQVSNNEMPENVDGDDVIDTGIGDPNNPANLAAPDDAATQGNGKIEIAQHLDNTGLRDGESGLGVISSLPSHARPLTEKEKQAGPSKKRDLLEVSAQAVRREQIIADSFTLPAPIKRALILGVVTAASVLLLFLVSQAASFAAQMQSLPALLQGVLGAGVVVSGAAIGYIIVLLSISFMRLLRSPSIKLAALQDLAQRGRLREMARRQQREAREELIAYVKGFPLDAPECLTAAGFSEDEIRRLALARENLLRSLSLSPEKWLTCFQDQFQQVLDETARRRVKAFAVKVGVGTAASSKALFDSAIILYAGLAMVQNLMAIYRLRPSGGSAALILAHVITQTYMGGHVQEATESVVDAFIDNPEAVFGPIIAKVLGKAAEGAINGILIHRLGSTTIKLLAPTVV